MEGENMSNKKTAKAPSAKIEEELVAPVFIGRTLNKDEIDKMRMRARDFLADCVKRPLDVELKMQEALLESGKTPDGTLTLNTEDLQLMQVALDAVCLQYASAQSAEKKAQGTYQKFVLDSATQTARIKIALAGNLKALSPEEKKLRAEVSAQKLAEVAALQAEILALGL
tara:strand:+ start:17069 stop:17578 length:510 start_codon:yes stop_codon:yes gene_type:complete